VTPALLAEVISGKPASQQAAAAAAAASAPVCSSADAIAARECIAAVGKLSVKEPVTAKLVSALTSLADDTCCPFTVVDAMVGAAAGSSFRQIWTRAAEGNHKGTSPGPLLRAVLVVMLSSWDDIRLEKNVLDMLC